MICGFFKKSKVTFVPTELERLKEFFVFCDLLEEHPFFVAHKSGGKFQLNCDFPETGEDSASLNFDEIHLESFLTRIRQFVLENELFYLKDLRRAMISELGEDKDFTKFYDKLSTSMNRPYPQSFVSAYKPNGKDIVAGYKFQDLLKARLYTGPIHSERRIDPTSPPVFTGVANAHVAVSKHLTLNLASSSLVVAQNIFVFRNQILRRARAASKIDLFAELRAFDTRSKAAGF